jgi:hypothetical protein
MDTVIEEVDSSFILGKNVSAKLGLDVAQYYRPNSVKLDWCHGVIS